MPVPADKPLRKVTLNLFEEDCRYLEARVGQGWSVKIREIIEEHCRSLRIVSIPHRKRTLGDLK